MVMITCVFLWMPLAKSSLFKHNQNFIAHKLHQTSSKLHHGVLCEIVVPRTRLKIKSRTRLKSVSRASRLGSTSPRPWPWPWSWPSSPPTCLPAGQASQNMWEVLHSRHVGSPTQPTCGKFSTADMWEVKQSHVFLQRRSTSTIRGMSDARGCCLILASYVPMHRKTSKVMCTRPRRHTLV